MPSNLSSFVANLLPWPKKACKNDICLVFTFTKHFTLTSVRASQQTCDQQCSSCNCPHFAEPGQGVIYPEASWILAGLSGTLVNAPRKGLILRFLTQKLITFLICDSNQKLKVGIPQGVLTPLFTLNKLDSWPLLGDVPLLLIYFVQLFGLIAVCNNRVIAWLYICFIFLLIYMP